MKTAKVTEVNEVKEWGDGDRKTFYHNLTLDNGDKINLGKKARLQVGTELNYEITDTTGQHEFSKAKSVNPEYKGNRGGKNDELIGLFACTKVIATIHAGSGMSEDQIAERAEALLNQLKAKA